MPRCPHNVRVTGGLSLYLYIFNISADNLAFDLALVGSLVTLVVVESFFCAANLYVNTV